MEKAINWWNSLTDYGKSKFPVPENDDDILDYYLNPGEYVDTGYDTLGGIL